MAEQKKDSESILGPVHLMPSSLNNPDTFTPVFARHGFWYWAALVAWLFSIVTYWLGVLGRWHKKREAKRNVAGE